MFLVMKLNRWEDINLKPVGHIKLSFPASLAKPDNGSIGYAEIYDTKENAIKANPNAKIIEVKEEQNET